MPGLNFGLDNALSVWFPTSSAESSLAQEFALQFAVSQMPRADSAAGFNSWSASKTVKAFVWWNLAGPVWNLVTIDRNLINDLFSMSWHLETSPGLIFKVILVGFHSTYPLPHITFQVA